MTPRLPYRLATALALAALLAPAAASALRLETPEKATLELAADRSAYEPGGTARIAALVHIEAGWHVNSHSPTFDYLIPTAVEFQPPQGWQAPEVSYPPGAMKTFAFAEVPLSVYDDQVVINGSFTVPEGTAAGDAVVVARLTYQACNDTQCLPPVTTERSVALPIGAAGAAANATVFTGEGPGATAPAAGGGGKAGGASLAWILLVALAGGLILNAMPCVLPVLSLKVFGMVRSASAGRRAVVAGSLATAAGIVVSFWALAGAAVAAKAAGSAVGWGIQFQNPAFVTFLAAVVVLFSLNLWGIFEVPLPGFLARVGSGGSGEGVGGHFVSGLFATLMATPCSAPFLGTALGFALAQEAPVIFAVFTAVGVGMALPYLALAAAPKTAALLPKPGAWMDLLKGLMGFLLAGAAIWLLYVLAAQVSAAELAAIETGLLAMGLFAWLHRRAKGSAGRRLALLGGVAAAALTLALPFGVAAGPGRAAGPDNGGGLIAWTGFDRTEAESLAAEGHLVFVDVTADWCFTCKFNEKLVLNSPEVAAAFERHGVVPMRADWTNRNQAIGDYLEEFGRYGIPFYVLYRPGAEPHVFSELLTKEAVLTALKEAGTAQQRVAAAGR
jgi:suppressor for copper-sensitivity B